MISRHKLPVEGGTDSEGFGRSKETKMPGCGAVTSENPEKVPFAACSQGSLLVIQGSECSPKCIKCCCGGWGKGKGCSHQSRLGMIGKPMYKDIMGHGFK